MIERARKIRKLIEWTGGRHSLADPASRFGEPLLFVGDIRKRREYPGLSGKCREIRGINGLGASEWEVRSICILTDASKKATDTEPKYRSAANLKAGFGNRHRALRRLQTRVNQGMKSQPTLRTGGFKLQKLSEFQFEHASELHVSSRRKFLLKNQGRMPLTPPFLTCKRSSQKSELSCMFVMTGANRRYVSDFSLDEAWLCSFALSAPEFLAPPGAAQGSDRHGRASMHLVRQTDRTYPRSRLKSGCIARHLQQVWRRFQGGYLAQGSSVRLHSRSEPYLSRACKFLCD